MEMKLKINREPIEVDFCNKIFMLDLVLNKYINGGIAIEVIDKHGELFTVLTINIGGIGPNEIVINHDDLVWANQVYHILSDEEPVEVQYGLATSDKLILKENIKEMFDIHFS